MACSYGTFEEHNGFDWSTAIPFRGSDYILWNEYGEEVELLEATGLSIASVASFADTPSTWTPGAPLNDTQVVILQATAQYRVAYRTGTTITIGSTLTRTGTTLWGACRLTDQHFLEFTRVGVTNTSNVALYEITPGGTTITHLVTQTIAAGSNGLSIGRLDDTRALLVFQNEDVRLVTVDTGAPSITISAADTLTTGDRNYGTPVGFDGGDLALVPWAGFADVDGNAPIGFERVDTSGATPAELNDVTATTLTGLETFAVPDWNIDHHTADITDENSATGVCQWFYTSTDASLGYTEGMFIYCFNASGGLTCGPVTTTIFTDVEAAGDFAKTYAMGDGRYVCPTFYGDSTDDVSALAVLSCAHARWGVNTIV